MRKVKHVSAKEVEVEVTAASAMRDHVHAAILDCAKTNDNGNSHAHRCQLCGCVWVHGNMMAGDVEAHGCPKCGQKEWRKYNGGQVTLKKKEPQLIAPQMFLGVPKEIWALMALLVASVVWGNLIYAMVTGE